MKNKYRLYYYIKIYNCLTIRSSATHFTTRSDFQTHALNATNKFPYEGSRKEPDLYVCPALDSIVPTFIIEAGWSDVAPLLREDVDLWLDGGSPATQVVMLILWHRIDNTDSVSGSVEVYAFDNATGTPVLRQREDIFPAPQTKSPQRIRITRGELFGPTVFPGRDPDEELFLGIEKLRTRAQNAMVRMKLVPAP